MALLDELTAAQEQGFKTATETKLGPGINPYTAGGPRDDADRAEAWAEGYEKGQRYVENRQQAAAAARRREEAQAAFDEKLTTFFGGDEFRDEFEQWLAEFIDARTR